MSDEVKKYCCPHCEKELKFIQQVLYIQLEEDATGEDAGLYKCKSCKKEYYKRMYKEEI